MAAVDLNRDGVLDLVTADYLTGGLTWASGAGDGTFAAPVALLLPPGDYAMNPCPTALAVADLDEDTVPDLAVLDACNDQVHLLIADTVGPELQDPPLATSRFPSALVPADLDDDQRPDLLVTTTGGWLDRLLAQPGGGFVARDPLAVGGVLNGIAAADYDGDGHLDVALTDLGTREVLLWVGTGDGELAPAGRAALDADPTDLAFADLDADGLPDLLATDEGSRLGVWQGSAGLGPEPLRTTTGPEPVDLQVADLLGDGCWSAMTANASGGVGLLLGRGDGTFTSSQPIQAGAMASALAVAQLDGGGPLDLAVADPNASVVQVYVGRVP